MTSRRTFLISAVGAVAGARVLSACADPELATEPTAGPTSSSAATSTSTSSASTSDPAPESSPPVARETVESTTSVLSGPSAWEGVDFGPLDVFIDRTGGDAFAIWEEGAMVHEWYRTDASYTRDIASSQKSILSLLVGRAIGDGLVQLATPIDDVLGQQWTPHGQNAGITVEHLLSMTSGLDDARHAMAAPGERWIYSGAFAAMFDVLTTITGREFERSGAGVAVRSGRRVGLDVLRAPGRPLRADRPAIDGARSDCHRAARARRRSARLAAGWIDRSFALSQTFNRSYGLLWWLNGQESFMLPGPNVPFPGSLVPSAPSSVVAALGKDDQKLYVAPEHGLVVARLGGRAVPASHAARSPFDVDLWERLIALR